MKKDRPGAVLFHRVQKGRFLRWTGLAAGGFLGLTGPLAPRVVVAASPQIKKKGCGWRRGLYRRVVKEKVDGPPARGFLRFLSLTRLRREGCCGGFAADDKVSVTGLAFWWEISRLRVSSKRFPSNTHTGASPPARDDDIGGHPYRHFDRSGAEWRNLTPQWARKRVRLSPQVV